MKVIIIGGGLGGLFTGAILSKEGFLVTVLEKNATIGGGLQTFRRFGESFDTGMHVIGGMHPGGNIYRICQYLGIIDRVQIKDVDDDCMDCLYFAEDKMTYRIRKGRNGFVDSLASYFPSQRRQLEAYVDAVFGIVEGVDLFNLRPSTDAMTMHTDDFLMAADAFVAKYIDEEKLRSVLSYMNPLYGGRGDETPAFIHAIITVLYVEGASRFVGGSSRFADLLASVITQGGGEVLTHEGAEWIEVNDRHVDFVRSTKQKEYRGDYYISAIHPCTLLKLMPEKAFPKAYRNRLDSIPNSYSAFSLYIKLKKDTFPYINHSEYYMTKYDEIWNFGKPHDAWPLGFLLMTPPDDDQGEFAAKALVTAPMLFSEVERWEDTQVGHRGEDYEAWKKQKTHDILERVEEIHPGFCDCIENINASSPLTIRDFYGVKEGALSGYSKDYKNMLLSQVPVVTKVSNLLLTGQNNNLHGFCGVPLTAINTVEAIVGKNMILNKIKQLLIVILFLIPCLVRAGEATTLKDLRMTPYLAQGEGNVAVVVCPGGSYFWHDMDAEGEAVGKWLQSNGISAFVLRYRTAGFWAFFTRFRYIFRGNRYPDALNDLHQSMTYLREHASEYGIDPNRLGAMGFSAGGHLVMSAAELLNPSERPAFVAPVYPVVTMTEQCVHKRSRRALLGDSRKNNRKLRDSLSLERHVPDDCPPVFLVNCKDDPIVKYHNSELLDSALTAHHVAHRYIQYQTGGHGFGATDNKGTAECRQWKNEFLKWLRGIF